MPKIYARAPDGCSEGRSEKSAGKIGNSSLFSYCLDLTPARSEADIAGFTVRRVDDELDVI